MVFECGAWQCHAALRVHRYPFEGLNYGEWGSYVLRFGWEEHLKLEKSSKLEDENRYSATGGPREGLHPVRGVRGGCHTASPGTVTDISFMAPHHFHGYLGQKVLIPCLESHGDEIAAQSCFLARNEPRR